METNFSHNESSSVLLNGTQKFETPVLKTVQDVILIAVLLFIMVAMGCNMTIREVWKHVKMPISVAIGMFSQFGLLPLCSFAISNAVSLTSNGAVGMLVLSCCPGGTMSNLFTYWTDGDVSLSITMTSLSTVLAFGMMPLNLLIYSSAWTSKEMVIPYVKICITLITILIPVIVGMLLKRFLPRLGVIVSKVGSIVGMLGIVLSLTIQSILFPGMYSSKWNVWVSAALFPLLGLLSGFVLAKLTRRNSKECKAISFETGSQNVALAMTVLFLTFPYQVLEEATAFPQLYAVIMLSEYGTVCLFYNIHRIFFSENEKDLDDGMKAKLPQDNLAIEQTKEVESPKAKEIAPKNTEVHIAGKENEVVISSF